MTYAFIHICIFWKFKAIIAAIPEIAFICLDVANGYSEHFVQYVRKVRSTFASQTIIAGNVVTGEMVEELILSGADIIKGKNYYTDHSFIINNILF